MKWTLFLLDETAERYCPDFELIRFYIKGGDVVLELEDENARMSVITLKCSNGGGRKVYDRVCESMLSHPGVIDLRETYVDEILES